MDWKRWLIATRYTASLPVRTYCNRRDYARGRAPAMILFYHRVADHHPNDWTISNGLFARQILWMKRRFEFVSLAEAQRRLRSGSNFEPTVSITFDDGYSDNCDHALPLLIRERIPCTYFVALEYIETGKSFPHDDAGVPLTPNSLDQLQFLADNGIEIGVHTRTHPDIGQVANRHTLLDEIVTVKTDLERQLGREIHYFAYPYGLPHNMTGESLEVAREAGYWGVCSAYGGYNLPGEESFHLLRFHGDPEMVRLKNWLSFDRRKLVPRNTPPSPRRELMSSVCDAR